MRVKFSDSALDKAKEAASVMKERINEMNSFIAKFDPEFWKLVSNDLDIRIENTSSDRESNFKKWTESEIKANVAEEKAYKHIKGLPIRIEKTRDQMMKDYTNLSKEIHDRATRSKD